MAPGEPSKTSLRRVSRVDAHATRIRLVLAETACLTPRISRTTRDYASVLLTQPRLATYIELQRNNSYRINILASSLAQTYKRLGNLDVWQQSRKATPPIYYALSLRLAASTLRIVATYFLRVSHSQGPFFSAAHEHALTC